MDTFFYIIYCVKKHVNILNALRE